MKTIIAAVLLLSVTAATAQKNAPKGFTGGELVLLDGTILKGYVREFIRARSSVVFMENEQAKKQTYNGAALTSAAINGTAYRCIKGDFFKVISKGDIDFLQKAGDASSQPSYNSGEAVFINGTEGSPGDYFLYDTRSAQLSLASKKNVDALVAIFFKDCSAAIDRAKSINGELSQLKDAVEVYNSRSK